MTGTQAVRAALAESEARYRTLFEHTAEAIVVLDVDRGTFVDANRKACALFGMPYEALTKCDPIVLSPPTQPGGGPSAEIAREHVDGALAGGVPRFEWQHRTSDARDVLCEVRLVRLPATGRRLVCGSVVDITQQRRLTERMSEVCRTEALGRLAAGVAHDLNNLLTIVTGAASMILQDNVSAETRSDAEAIVAAAKQGCALAAQLVGFGRENSPGTVHDLNEVVRTVTNLLNRVIGPRVTLVLRLEPKGAHVLVNRSQLEQVITNLVLNAHDAIDGNPGSITISTRCDESSTTLRVADTGAGMREDVRRRIFEPFFTTKTGTGGSGLGLANVQGIVTKAGGAIEVRSVLGVGTAVEVVFPRTGA